MSLADNFGLGRKHASDSRDFQLRAVMPLLDVPEEAELPEAHTHYIGWRGNQGREGTCVGFAVVHKLHCGPITQFIRGKGRPVIDPVEAIYLPAQKEDEWAGEAYDGTSVRAGMKIAQRLGFIESYYFGNTLEQLLRLLAAEPVVVGINWYENLWRPDPRGRVEIGASRLVGGHGICAIGYSLPREEVVFLQSYGEGHGDRGKIRIGFKDMRRLLAEEGELCLAIEKKRVSVK